MSQEEKEQQSKLEIQLDDEIAQGVYANLALVHHNETEFTLDFIYVQPQGRRAKVRSRVILSPAQAEGLLRALQQNLAVSAGKAEVSKTSVAPDDHYH